MKVDFDILFDTLWYCVCVYINKIYLYIYIVYYLVLYIFDIYIKVLQTEFVSLPDLYAEPNPSVMVF